MCSNHSSILTFPSRCPRCDLSVAVQGHLAVMFYTLSDPDRSRQACVLPVANCERKRSDQPLVPMVDFAARKMLDREFAKKISRKDCIREVSMLTCS
jgi:hypothetical protein